MESGQDSARNRDKENRDKVVGAEIVAVQYAACIPVIPDFSKRESEYKNTNKYSDCREQKNRTR